MRPRAERADEKMVAPTSALAIDETELARKVRAALKSPEFEITDWRSTALTGHTSNPATGGLYRLSGSGGDRQGHSDWSLILKVAHLTADAPPGWGTDLL